MNSNTSSNPGRHAEDLVALLFDKHGWNVEREPGPGPHRAHLLVKKGRDAYAVEIKTASEGRRDRVIPLLSQAILQSQANAREIGTARPLAVLYVADASPSLLKQVIEFSKRFAAGVAVGVIFENGARYFLGKGLQELNLETTAPRRTSATAPGRIPHMFSDLNQWMLKVLLAPEIQERLLTAPRGEYRNVSELAAAADVSVMSAYRFAHQLREEGFLDESSQRLKLVRRDELFRRWQSAALRSSPELRMGFLIRGAAQAQLRKIVSGQHACLGLFAAADAFGLGHVEGVPSYVYVAKLPRLDPNPWKELVPASPGEPFDLILRQARAPQSVFRGAVHLNGMAVSDVLQVWLDVSAHPSRGREQGELIRRKALKGVVTAGPA